MRVLRLIYGVTRRDRIRNTKIANDLGVEPILSVIEKSRLQWYGHIRRMAEERVPKKAWEWKPTTGRPRRRPRKRWMDNIKTSFEQRGTTTQTIEQEQLFMDRQR